MLKSLWTFLGILNSIHSMSGPKLRTVEVISFSDGQVVVLFLPAFVNLTVTCAVFRQMARSKKFGHHNLLQGQRLSMVIPFRERWEIDVRNFMAGRRAEDYLIEDRRGKKIFPGCLATWSKSVSYMVQTI